jgi:hypothetical protein
MNDWRETFSRHVPDFESLRTSGETYLGPAAGAALVVFALGLLAFGRKASVPASALALLVGFAVANYRYPQFPWIPELRREALPWQWLPAMLVLVQIDGVLGQSQGVPWWGKWRLRLVTGFIAALLVVPANLPAEWPVHVHERTWPLAVFTLMVALGWVGSEAVARQSPGGAVGLGLAAALFGASIVVLHAHYGKCAEVMTFPAAALVGMSIVALIRKSDIGGAVPAVALLLPTLLLIGATESYSEVPWYAFLLAALPPMTVGLLTIPALARQTGFTKWLLFWVFCLGPAIAAVVIAMRVEELPKQDW